MKAVADARAIGYADGIVDRVDAIDQKMQGLEADINLREQNLDQKTQECVAKVADLNQVGKYLERYTQVVNNRLVPTMRNLILAMKNGITHHTEDVAKDVYEQFKMDTNLTVQEVIKQAVSQVSAMLNEFIKFLVLFGIELVILGAIVAVPPGWPKLLAAPIGLLLGGVIDWKIYKNGGWG